MLYDFIITDKSDKLPMYRQIYFSIRNAIENGSLKKGTRMPSIRKLSAELGVSVTTVVTAYDQLRAEGYIKNKPRSGYFTAAQFEGFSKAEEEPADKESSERSYYEYDFSSKSIDENILDFSQWKKNIRDVINRNYLLTSYGDAQGEPALREALQRYAMGLRSVRSSAQSIVVSAGTQPALLLLCSLLGTNKRVAMAKNSFVQSEYVFKSFGYDISYFESDENGASVNSLKEINPDILLINPNFSEPSGTNMSVERRIEIIKWAKEKNVLIVEDDYNGELRYITHPMPCIQNYDSDITVYIGSFSKVLLPSVRISYMVLPESLMIKYKKISRLINQTASKTEQLALAAYINNGKIDAHLRKARRIYHEKSKTALKTISRLFPNARAVLNETSLYISLRLPYSVDREQLEKALELSSVRLMPYRAAENELGISFSGIPSGKLESGMKLIKEACEKSRLR